MRIPLGKGRAITWQLGTLGLRSGNWYGDLFLGGTFSGKLSLRRFINDGVAMRRWETLTRRGWRTDRIEILDAINAARIFRRTMKPYVLLHDIRTGHVVEAMSYPCPNPGSLHPVTIMVRTTPEDPTTLAEFDCRELGPVSFEPTNVPAENPV